MDLHRALTDAVEIAGEPLLPVPDTAAELLTEVQAPPRLGAHLRLVHDVAHRLTASLGRLDYNRTAVLFGAATHDIGKVEHPEELSGPGSKHEPAGYALLIRFGVPDEFARFARTHASWTLPGLTVDDLLVSVADKVWKAKRVTELEDLVVRQLAEATGTDMWEAFLVLDEVLGSLAQHADERLAVQANYPI